MSFKVLIYSLFISISSSAFGQGQSIKIGELNSYKVFPAFLEPYKKGWELALEEINGSGGVLGRRLEVVSRDDGGTPGDAVLVPEDARLNKKRWAIVVPNYEYGQSAAASFRKLLAQAQPGVEFVAEQAPPLGKIDAGALVQALLEARPEAIFSALCAVDLQKFVREGNTRGLFKSAAVVNLLGGEPEYLDPLKDETPEGWWVTGYPWSEINTPEHTKFRDAYQKRWKDYPRLGSVVGYSALHAVANGIRKAGSLDADRLIAALEGLQMETPFGEILWRPLDHQSTMGAYVGQLAKKGGQGVMVNWHYADGAKVQPSDQEVRALRKE